jgi:hypothetical protein
MIAADLRVEGFDARSWTNLLSLFAPNVAERPRTAPRTSDAPEIDEADLAGAPAKGTLVLVIGASGRVLAARHTRRGRVKGLTYDGPASLPSLAASHGARRVLVIREGALEDLTQRASARFDRHDDYAAQWLHVIRAVRNAIDAGAIDLHPRPLAAIPIPSAQVLSRAVDAVLPDDRAMILGVFSRTTPWTLVALRRAEGEIDRIVGPDVILRWTGPLGGDFRRDHRLISDAIAQHLAPVHLGIFADEADIKTLLRDETPGAWARAVVARDIIVQPTPPYVAVALAADGMRAAAKRTETWLSESSRVRDVLGQLAPLASFVRGRAAEVASVTQILGFDPLKLLAAWLERTDDELATATSVGNAMAPDDEDDDADEELDPSVVAPSPDVLTPSQVPPDDLDDE